MADGAHKEVDLGKQSAIAKWTRNTLEDSYLRLYDEQHSLKKHARKQEEKIKRFDGGVGGYLFTSQASETL